MNAIDVYFLLQEYVMEALSGKTVLLVTHQVDFLPAFHSILVSDSFNPKEEFFFFGVSGEFRFLAH